MSFYHFIIWNIGNETSKLFLFINPVISSLLPASNHYHLLPTRHSFPPLRHFEGCTSTCFPCLFEEPLSVHKGGSSMRFRSWLWQKGQTSYLTRTVGALGACHVDVCKVLKWRPWMENCWKLVKYGEMMVGINVGVYLEEPNRLLSSTRNNPSVCLYIPAD